MMPGLMPSMMPRMMPGMHGYGQSCNTDDSFGQQAKAMEQDATMFDEEGEGEGEGEGREAASEE